MQMWTCLALPPSPQLVRGFWAVLFQPQQRTACSLHASNLPVEIKAFTASAPLKELRQKYNPMRWNWKRNNLWRKKNVCLHFTVDVSHQRGWQVNGHSHPAAPAASGVAQQDGTGEAELGTGRADRRSTVCLSNLLCIKFIFCWKTLLNFFVAKFDLFWLSLESLLWMVLLCLERFSHTN